VSEHEGKDGGIVGAVVGAALAASVYLIIKDYRQNSPSRKVKCKCGQNHRARDFWICPEC